ncbi:hypothetical protein [Caudoviricetes sp.]|nr:hypothetical protein [Caudoviricetes sp.]UOF81873.1 hypothetical protein [Caudoviricetes sp.]
MTDLRARVRELEEACRTIAKRQREADLRCIRTMPCNCEHGCAVDAAVDAVVAHLEATPLVTEET